MWSSCSHECLGSFWPHARPLRPRRCMPAPSRCPPRVVGVRGVRVPCAAAPSPPRLSRSLAAGGWNSAARPPLAHGPGVRPCTRLRAACWRSANRPVTRVPSAVFRLRAQLSFASFGRCRFRTSRLGRIVAVPPVGLAPRPNIKCMNLPCSPSGAVFAHACRSARGRAEGSHPKNKGECISIRLITIRR